jgi:predicted signal transduction protein with EAL and GGDEF domain
MKDTVELLIDRADHAMYQAKASGRNRVAVSPPVLRRTGADMAIPEKLVRDGSF